MADSKDLFEAVKSGNADKVKTLLQDGKYDINKVYHDGHTPLYYACKKGDLEMVRMLVLEFNANVNASCIKCVCSYVIHLQYPLLDAILNGKKEVALALINEFGADCNVKGFKGQSVLHYACRGGNVSLVCILICEHKADVNAHDDDKKTPLLVAAENGNEEIALILINEFGADCNVKDRWGQSVLHHACRQGNVSLVWTLCEHKADVNAYDDDKKTSLSVAAENGEEEIALGLITEFGANCNVGSVEDVIKWKKFLYYIGEL